MSEFVCMKVSDLSPEKLVSSVGKLIRSGDEDSLIVITIRNISFTDESFVTREE